MQEIFKDIDGYEGLYQVSNLGRVKSLNFKRTGEERILKPGKVRNGYLQVELHKEGEGKAFLVHRLVAQAFIPNPNNLPQVNHKDENKENNFIYVNPDGAIDQEKSNLEWCDRKYNCNFGSRNERVAESRRGKFGKDAPRSKPVLQFTKTGEFLREWECAKDVERKLRISQSHISDCCLGKLKSTGGFIWNYK